MLQHSAVYLRLNCKMESLYVGLEFASEHLVAVVCTSVAVCLGLLVWCVCPRRPKETREAGEPVTRLYECS